MYENQDPLLFHHVLTSIKTNRMKIPEGRPTQELLFVVNM